MGICWHTAAPRLPLYAHTNSCTSLSGSISVSHRDIDRSITKRVPQLLERLPLWRHSRGNLPIPIAATRKRAPILVSNINSVLAAFGLERRSLQQSLAVTQKPLSARWWNRTAVPSLMALEPLSLWASLLRHPTSCHGDALPLAAHAHHEALGKFPCPGGHPRPSELLVAFVE